MKELICPRCKEKHIKKDGLRTTEKRGKIQSKISISFINFFRRKLSFRRGKNPLLYGRLGRVGESFK
jgi:hypothetical protein